MKRTRPSCVPLIKNGLRTCFTLEENHSEWDDPKVELEYFNNSAKVSQEYQYPARLFGNLKTEATFMGLAGIRSVPPPKGSNAFQFDQDNSVKSYNPNCTLVTDVPTFLNMFWNQEMEGAIEELGDMAVTQYDNNLSSVLFRREDSAAAFTVGEDPCVKFKPPHAALYRLQCKASFYSFLKEQEWRPNRKPTRNDLVVHLRYQQWVSEYVAKSRGNWVPKLADHPMPKDVAELKANNLNENNSKNSFYACFYNMKSIVSHPLLRRFCADLIVYVRTEFPTNVVRKHLGDTLSEAEITGKEDAEELCRKKFGGGGVAATGSVGDDGPSKRARGGGADNK